MATLKKGVGTIVVPDDAVAEYVAHGWRDTNAPVEVVSVKPRRSRKPVDPTAVHAAVELPVVDAIAVTPDTAD